MAQTYLALRATDTERALVNDTATAYADTLRLAGAFTAVDVVVMMSQAGYPVSPQQVEQLPSICCGGCSG